MIVKSLDHLNLISKSISKKLENGDCIFLIGEIGVGKTTFTRFLINNLQSQKGLKEGQIISEKIFSDIEKKDLWKITTKNQKTMASIENLKNEYDAEMKEISLMFSEKVDKVQSGDDLLPGVLKMVKVFVAVKRKLSLYCNKNFYHFQNTWQ